MVANRVRTEAEQKGDVRRWASDRQQLQNFFFARGEA
jgi:hypothetical protein